MPGKILVCPHCGHDGTPETAKSAAGSCGFNYLAEDVVCREVRAQEEGGKLLLSSDFRCQGTYGSNPRIECRSCWQAFPVPEGLTLAWAPAAIQPTVPPPPAAPLPTDAPPAGSVLDAQSAAARMSESLAVLLREAVQEVERPTTARLDSLEQRLEQIRESVAGGATLRVEVSAMLEKMAALTEAKQSVESKLAALEAGMQEEAAGARLAKIEEQFRAEMGPEGRLALALAQVQESLRSAQKRLDTQADAIRVLHEAAREQLLRRQELQAAVQKLEEIAGALEQPKPLPDDL